MDDCISREAAKEKLKPMVNDPEAVDFWEWQCSEIDSIPSADVRSVVRGEWVEENTRPRSSQFYCSACHRTAYDPQPTRSKEWVKRCRYAFCPNCGADMREVKDEP